MTKFSTIPRRISDTQEEILELADGIGDGGQFDDRRVRQACLDVAILRNFAFRSMASDVVGTTIRNTLRSDEQYAEAFSKHKPIVREFQGCLRAIAEAGQADELVVQLSTRLARVATSLRQTLKETVDVFVEIVEKATADEPLDDGQRPGRVRALQVANETNIELAKRTYFIEAEEQQERVLRKLEKTEAATGAILSDSLGHHYQTYANKERQAANMLRGAAIGVLLFIAGVAGYYVLLAEHQTFVAQLVKLSVSVPLLALAVYLARESTRHRAAERWSSELGIALHTLPLYFGELNTEDQSVCRRALGMRIVSPNQSAGAAPAGEGQEASEPIDTQSIVDGVKSLLDLKLPGSRSSDEK